MQTIKTQISLVQAPKVFSCEGCFIQQTSGLQCPANKQGELLCPQGMVWQTTHWRDATSKTLTITLED